MRARDDGRSDLRERIAKLRADERTYRSHVFERHVDIGPATTQERAGRKFAAQSEAAQHRPSHATRWTSDRHLARAVDGIERSSAYRTAIVSAKTATEQRGEAPQTIRPVIRLPLRDVLGPDWRSAVAGHSADRTGVRPARFTDTADVVAVYRHRPGVGWILYTCYPTPAGKP